MAVIKAKNPKLTGTVVGVSFVDGVANVESAQALAFFRSQKDKYTIEQPKAELPKPVERQAD